jgi:hypothetical protein
VRDEFDCFALLIATNQPTLRVCDAAGDGQQADLWLFFSVFFQFSAQWLGGGVGDTVNTEKGSAQ